MKQRAVVFVFIKLIYCFFHAEGLRNTRIGKISSLPRIIQNDIVSFARGVNAEKLQAGPTASRPGPTLLILVRADENDTPKLTSSRDIISDDIRMIRRCVQINRRVERIVFSSTTFPSSFTTSTERGCTI